MVRSLVPLCTVTRFPVSASDCLEASRHPVRSTLSDILVLHHVPEHIKRFGGALRKEPAGPETGLSEMTVPQSWKKIALTICVFPHK